MGMDRSASVSYHSTVSTCSTCSTSAFSEATSSLDIFSKIKKVNAPLLKSSKSSFCPMTVSISDGR